MMTPRQRAERTRAFNRESTRMYLEVSKPAHEKVEKILNQLLLREDIRLRFVGPRRLKGGVTEGRLMAISFGGLGFSVHVDGYKAVNQYSSNFWEIL